MNINRHNYEIVFLDYLDRHLSPVEVADLLLFLEENPDLKEELESLETINLEPDPALGYPEKEKLHKQRIISVGPVNELTAEEYLIGRMEGDLSPAEERFLDRFLFRNSSMQKEQKLFLMTRLVPDPGIIFTEKSSLKKYPVRAFYRRSLVYATALAATLLIVLLVFNPFNRNRYLEEARLITARFGTLEPGTVTDSGQQVDPPLTVIAGHDMDRPVSWSSFASQEKTENIESVVSYSPQISKMASLHGHITYRIVNASFDPGKDIRGTERKLYSPSLPYITSSGDYALTTRQQEESGYGSMSEFAFNRIKGIFTRKEKEDNKLPEFNLWTLADIGVYGLSQITDSDLRIDRIKDEQGNTISYALLNNDREITRFRSKKQTGRASGYE